MIYYKPILCFIILGIIGVKRFCITGSDLDETVAGPAAAATL
jgi:hypothetical protein